MPLTQQPNSTRNYFPKAGFRSYTKVVDLKTSHHQRITGQLHIPVPSSTEKFEWPRACVIWGAGGGTHGPSNIYDALCTYLSSHHGILGFRLEYRYPNDLVNCVKDVETAKDVVCSRGLMSKLVKQVMDMDESNRTDSQEKEKEWHEDILKIENIGLVGWSFGGAVAITAGARDPRVKAVATIASQTYGTDDAPYISPAALLLIHGTGDKCLSDRCSRQCLCVIFAGSLVQHLLAMIAYNRVYLFPKP
ncbi:hypothetical protein BKA69DRAFT_194306 [Paraphysoderma sedebokerense]|nr:hypothetical protein BKA69DRAFT_194306 [Paraphysoderma sedebokerense]